MGTLALYDITLTLFPGMPTFPGEPGPELTAVQRLAEGAAANVSRLSLGMHSGTHVDAPLHFFEGAEDATSLPLSSLCGPARLVRIRSRPSVTVEALESAGLEGATRVLLKTDNSRRWDEPVFHRDFVHLEPKAAQWLASKGFVLVGLDSLSIERFGAKQPLAHRALLGAKVVVLEGLDLRQPPPGDYELWCLPLKVAGGEAAPARVVLAPPVGRRT